MKYIDRLKERIAENEPPDQPLKPPEPSFRGFSGDRRGPFSENVVQLDPIRLQKEWRAHLARLDDCQPLAGYSPGRWWRLVDDACWVFNEFGDQAARNGWSTADLFGRWPHIDGWGGIADRLRGSRSLKMSGEVATWRWGDDPQKYPRGVYPDLKPFWEKVDG